MMRPIATFLSFLSFVMMALLLPAGAASAQGFLWWQDDHFTRELRLTAEQSRRIEAIFKKELPTLQRNREALEAAEHQLERIVYTATEAELMQQIARVEEARVKRNTARMLMLLRMRHVLDDDQRVKLTALHRDWERRLQQGGPPPPPR